MKSLIPDDLVVSEIVSRLPIKSIIRCKTVCKAWPKLLSDLNFTKNYENNTPFATVLVPCILSRPSFCQREFSLLEIDCKNGNINSCNLMHIDPKLADRLNMISTSFLEVVGSCYGLLLLSSRRFFLNYVPKDVYICNPIMNEIIQLLQPNSVFSSMHYSFGYILATEQFKVLRVAVEPRLVDDNTEGEIITVGVDLDWRPLRVPMNSFFRLKDGITFKGVYHWTLSICTTPDNWIHTFDLGEEKLDGIPPPPGLSGHRNFLKVFDSCLSIFDLSDSCRITLWME